MTGVARAPGCATDLLARFYDATAGRITVEGQDGEKWPGPDGGAGGDR